MFRISKKWGISTDAYQVGGIKFFWITLFPFRKCFFVQVFEIEGSEHQPKEGGNQGCPVKKAVLNCEVFKDSDKPNIKLWKMGKYIPPPFQDQLFKNRKKTLKIFLAKNKNVLVVWKKTYKVHPVNLVQMHPAFAPRKARKKKTMFVSHGSRKINYF